MLTVKLSLLAQLLCCSLVSGMRTRPMAVQYPSQAPLYVTESLEEAGIIIKDASAHLQIAQEFPEDLFAEPLFKREQFDLALSGFNSDLGEEQEVEEKQDVEEMQVVEEPEVDEEVRVVPAPRIFDAADLVLAASGLSALEERSIMFALSSPAKIDEMSRNGVFAQDGGHAAQLYLSHLLSLSPAELLAFPHAVYIVGCLFRYIPVGSQHLFMSKMFNLPGSAPRTMDEFHFDDAYARLQFALLSQMASVVGEVPGYLIDQYAESKRLNYYVMGEFLNHFNRYELSGRFRKAYFVEIFEAVLLSPHIDLELFELAIDAGVRYEDVVHFFAAAPMFVKDHFRTLFRSLGVAQGDDESFQFGTIPDEPILFLDTSDCYDPLQSLDF